MRERLEIIRRKIEEDMREDAIHCAVLVAALLGGMAYILFRL